MLIQRFIHCEGLDDQITAGFDDNIRDRARLVKLVTYRKPASEE